MNQPWVYMCSPSWIPLPPPSPSHPSGSSQCTSPEHLSNASNLDWRSVVLDFFKPVPKFKKKNNWCEMQCWWNHAGKNTILLESYQSLQLRGGCLCNLECIQSLKNIHIHNQQGPIAEHRELCSMSCGTLNGRRCRGEWIHVHVWLSPFLFTETSTAWLIGYISTQIKKLNVWKRNPYPPSAPAMPMNLFSKIIKS